MWDEEKEVIFGFDKLEDVAVAVCTMIDQQNIVSFSAYFDKCTYIYI